VEVRPDRPWVAQHAGDLVTDDLVNSQPGPWRLEVDASRCIGSGGCVAVAPGRFALTDGVAVPSAGPVPPDDALIDAAESCPVEAITVRDLADGRTLAPSD